MTLVWSPLRSDTQLSTCCPAKRIRERRLRAFQRYERWTVAMEMAAVRHQSYHKTQSQTSVGVQTDDVVPAVPVMTDITCLLEPPVPPVLTEYVAPALAAVYDEPAPMIEYMTPGPDVTCTAPAPVIEYVPDDTYAVTCAAAPDHTYIAPASPRVNRDIRGLVDPQFSTFAVEASASQVVGSFPAVDESAPPIYKQVHQKQMTKCTFSLFPQRERLLRTSKRNCVTLMGVTTKCSNRPSRRRPASSQTGTSSPSTFSRAEVFFSQPTFNGKEAADPRHFFPVS